VKLFTSYDPAMACAISTVGIEGIAPGAIVEHLWKTRRIIVTPIVHPEYQGVRVTPNVYTSLEDIDTFADAMERIIRNGLPAS
jgi:selenocysteine lyase/cysteine desulfurase